jgi:NAD(P)-dependent dehydrogenase (short-subunit alcohol dehydrogenase family)
MGRFDGKVVIVTGATKAMGATIATRFGNDGAAVVGVGRSVEEGEGVARSIRDRGGEALFVQADVSDEAEVEGAVAAAVDHFGSVDIIVNNAAPMRGDGADDHPKALADLPTEHFDWQMKVCVYGPFWFAKYGIPHMVAAGGGSIVNISSGAAARGVRAGGGYGPAKAALEALGRGLAVDYGPLHIRVNTVRLGAIRVPGNAGLHDNPAFAAALQEARIVPREGTPADVAAMVAFLASDESGFITGEVFVVDGGAAAKHRGVNYAESVND